MGLIPFGGWSEDVMHLIKKQIRRRLCEVAQIEPVSGGPSWRKDVVAGVPSAAEHLLEDLCTLDQGRGRGGGR